MTGKARVQNNRSQHELSLGELHGMVRLLEIFIRHIADGFRIRKDVLKAGKLNTQKSVWCLPAFLAHSGVFLIIIRDVERDDS